MGHGLTMAIRYGTAPAHLRFRYVLKALAGLPFQTRPLQLGVAATRGDAQHSQQDWKSKTWLHGYTTAAKCQF
jgi:hypothetical protein